MFYIKSASTTNPVTCELTHEFRDLLTFKVAQGSGLQVGEIVAIIEEIGTTFRTRSGTVTTISGDVLKIHSAAQSSSEELKKESLADCQLPAMIRPRSDQGSFGCWKGAVIVKHGPDRLVLQVEDKSIVPTHAELMFSPIGAESNAGAGRMYNDDGSVIGGSDVRSKRIRIRAVTSNVLPSTVEGTILLVMDVSRTLYRTA